MCIRDRTPHYQSDISGIVEISRIDVPSNSAVAEPIDSEHPFAGLKLGIRDNIASVSTDARNLEFTDDVGMTAFSACVKEQTEGFVGSFSDPSINMSISYPANGTLNSAAKGAWNQFAGQLNSSGVAKEFSNKTSAMEINITGNEVIIPGSSLVIACVQFSFFYWIWYQHVCLVPQLHSSFRPTKPKRTGFFTFKPSAACDPIKIENTIREMFTRASGNVLEWNGQLIDFVDKRLDPLRKLDSIVE